MVMVEYIVSDQKIYVRIVASKIASKKIAAVKTVLRCTVTRSR